MTPNAVQTDRAGSDPRLVDDQRGAVMVLGIFMCACLVGGLWYIAGIGSAIVYRERLQEAADATAFSGAVLHARGMNLIVLINLIMACVLAIRVAMKLLQVAMIAAAIVFGLIGIFVEPFLVASKLCVDGAKLMQDLIVQTRPMINNTLKALSKVELGIKYVVPPAAIAGSYQVADEYRPTVKVGFSGTSATRYASGLPVEEGTADRLCAEAGRAVTEVIKWAIPIDALRDGDVGDAFSDLTSSMVRAGSAYFCEMGKGGAPPDMSDFINGGAKEGCEKKRQKYEQEYNETNGPWHAECDRLKALCIDENLDDPFEPRPKSEMSDISGLKPAERANLQKLQSERDAKADQLHGFDEGTCRDEEKKRMKKEIDKAMPQQSQSSSGSGMTPKKVEAKWANGRKDTQMIAWITGNDRLLQRAPGGVRIGAWKNTRPEDIDKPNGADFAYAQAEFFYDCAGKWKDGDCNGKGGDQEEAMWHFRWRARLRRYNTPYDDLPRILEAAYLLPAEGSLVKRAGLAVTQRNSLNVGNLDLKKELMETIGVDAKTYAIH